MTWVLGRNLPSAVIAKHFPQANNHNPKTPTNASPHSNPEASSQNPEAATNGSPLPNPNPNPETRNQQPETASNASRTPTLISILTNQTHFDKKDILQKMKTAGFSRKQTTDAANYLFKKLLEINRIQAVSRNQQPGSNHQHPVASSLPNLEEAIDINHFLALGQHETAWYLAEEAKNKAWNHADYPAVLHFLEVQIQIAERAYSFNTDFQETTTLFAQKRQVLALLDQINQHREAYHQARQIAHSNLSKPQEQRVRSAQKIQDLLNPLQKSIPVTSNQSESNHSRLSAFTFQPSAASEASPPNLSASLSLYQYKIQYFHHLLLEEQDQLIKISQNSLNCFQRTPNLIQTYPESYVRTCGVLIANHLASQEIEKATSIAKILTPLIENPKFPQAAIHYYQNFAFWQYWDEKGEQESLKNSWKDTLENLGWWEEMEPSKKANTYANLTFYCLVFGEIEKAKELLLLWETDMNLRVHTFNSLHFRLLKILTLGECNETDLLEYFLDSSRKKFQRHKSKYPHLFNLFKIIKGFSQAKPAWERRSLIEKIPEDFGKRSVDESKEIYLNYIKYLREKEGIEKYW